MATLHDVAKAANVSIATASRALGDSARRNTVSERTRETVIQVAEQLGYRPSAAARALKTGRTRLIGVIASDFVDSYYGEMASGIEAEASRSGFAAVLSTAARSSRDEGERLRFMREQNAAGVVFCGSPIAGSDWERELAEEVEQAIDAGMRVVSLAPRGFGSLELVIDNEATGYEITQQFLRAGHRRIAFLGGLPGLVSADARTAGYLRAMAEAGEEAQVLDRRGMTHEAGRIAAQEAMAGRTRPTALLATNDELALGALAELWALGYAVPEDVSVACVGGTRMTRAFDMAHIALPLAELGRIAAAYIAEAEPGNTHGIDLPDYRFVAGRTMRELR